MEWQGKNRRAIAQCGHKAHQLETFYLISVSLTKTSCALIT